MYRDKKVVVVMPAYNAARTLVQTHKEVMHENIVDLVIVVDDASDDETVTIARTLSNTTVHVHEANLGYGANQKTCYQMALDAGGDIVIMVHPDYQYTPKLIPAMVSLIGNDIYACVLGSRILGGHAVKEGMPWWRYVVNRFLTAVQNAVLGSKLSEFHTGYRAFSREVLQRLPLHTNSDDFVFDNQMLAQVLWFGFPVGEISCPTRYAAESSSINFARSVRYGVGCLATSAEFALAAARIIRSRRFPVGGDAAAPE